MLFLIRWLAHCWLPLHQIETWSLVKGQPIEMATCWLMTCSLMLLLVREHVVRETPAKSCGYRGKDRYSSDIDDFYCGLSLGLVFQGLYIATCLHVPRSSLCVVLCLSLFLIFIHIHLVFVSSSKTWQWAIICNTGLKVQTLPKIQPSLMLLITFKLLVLW